MSPVKGVPGTVQRIPRTPPPVKGVPGRIETVPRGAGHPRLPAPVLGRVSVTSSVGNAFTAILNGPPVPLAVNAGWEEVERTKRQAALWHKGTPLKGWVLPVLFDGWRFGMSVEPGVGQLMAMTRRAGGEDPPAIRVLGVGAISPITDWVVSTIDPEGDALWGAGRVRLRAGFTVTLLERVLPDLVAIKPAQAARTKSGQRRTKTYVVKAGDANLQRIALRELGDVSRWRQIKDSKGKAIRDPKRIRVGQKLRLP